MTLGQLDAASVLVSRESSFPWQKVHHSIIIYTTIVLVNQEHSRISQLYVTKFFHAPRTWVENCVEDIKISILTDSQTLRDSLFNKL